MRQKASIVSTLTLRVKGCALAELQQYFSSTHKCDNNKYNQEDDNGADDDADDDDDNGS